jgi:phage/plasmid-associated DNA primase
VGSNGLTNYWQPLNAIADKEIEVDRLYAAYRPRCEDNEHPKLSKQLFGRDLRQDEHNENNDDARGGERMDQGSN